MKNAYRRNDHYPGDKGQRFLHKSANKAEYSPAPEQKEHDDIESRHAAVAKGDRMQRQERD
jgi:hypothetical protein